MLQRGHPALHPAEFPDFVISGMSAYHCQIHCHKKKTTMNITHSPWILELLLVKFISWYIHGTLILLYGNMKTL